MQLITTEYIEDIAELMDDSDYSRFPWGGDVTFDVIHAAAVVMHREANGTPDLDDSMEAEAEILRILNRGWTVYDDLAELAAQDEEGDHLNSLLIRFGFSGAQRDEADKRIGRTLIDEAREKGETVVWYDDKDVPGLRLVPGIIIFNKGV